VLCSVSRIVDRSIEEFEHCVRHGSPGWVLQIFWYFGNWLFWISRKRRPPWHTKTYADAVNKKLYPYPKSKTFGTDDCFQ
jgi:hypothetical protein